MAYLGNSPVLSQQEYRNIDNISGSFNGVTTSFALLVNGVAPVPAPQSSNQCLISVNGVVQKPDDTGATGFRISGGNIIFSSAPTGGQSFFGVILAGADYIYAGQNFPDGTVSAPSITFNQDLDTGFYRSGAGEVKFTANGANAVTLSSNNLTAPSFIPTSSSAPTNGIYLPAANSVAISTGGSGRLFINSAGNVGIGAANTGAAFLEVNGSLRWQTQGIFRNSTNTSTLLRFAEIGSRDVRLDTWDGTDFNGTIRHGAQTYLVETGTGASLTERLRITSAGLVGVGTSSPNARLHSVETAAAEGLRVDGAAGGFSLVVEGGTNRVTRLRQATIGNSYFGNTPPTDGLLVQGSVGIGSASPDANLTLGGLTNTGGQSVDALNVNRTDGLRLFGIKWDVSSNEVRFSGNTKNYVFRNGSSEAETARIDSSGRLLVGTSSSSASARAVFQGNSFAGSQPGIIYLQRDTSSTGLTAGTAMGYIIFADNAGSNYAVIGCEADASTGTNDYPSRLTFSVTQDGQSSPTERVRIENNGRRLHFSSNDGCIQAVSGAASTSTYVFVGRHSSTSTTSGTDSFYVFSNGNVQNTNNSYTAISDIKLKENIVDANSQWDDIKALQVRNYNLKKGQTHKQIGLIAQEVEPISPGLVYESPDRDAEGNDLGTVTKSVNYSVLYMKAVKALQEAMERIEKLEAEMAEVKAQFS